MGKVKGKKKRKPLPQKVREAASAAMQGNDWWNLRSKHGRDKLFAEPKLMWEAACEYFKYVDEHPDYMTKPMTTSVGGNSGSVVEMVEVPVKQPYTLHGLCIYLGCSTAYFRMCKQSYDKEKDKGFFTVIAEIEDVIYKQQFNGAASGFFNGNIISRALGLVERQDHTSGDAPISAPVINVYKGNTPPLDEENKKGKK